MTKLVTAGAVLVLAIVFGISSLPISSSWPEATLHILKMIPSKILSRRMTI
jgi:hypothetical protein